jgi:hypothetical protein
LGEGTIDGDGDALGAEPNDGAAVWVAVAVRELVKVPVLEAVTVAERVTVLVGVCAAQSTAHRRTAAATAWDRLRQGRRAGSRAWGVCAARVSERVSEPAKRRPPCGAALSAQSPALRRTARRWARPSGNSTLAPIDG